MRMGLNPNGRLGRRAFRVRKLLAWRRLSPEPSPTAFLSPGAVRWARAYRGGGGVDRREGSQPAGHAGGKQGQGGPFPRACSWPFPLRGAAGSEEKGPGWEAGAGGRGWGLSSRRRAARRAAAGASKLSWRGSPGEEGRPRTYWAPGLPHR